MSLNLLKVLLKVLRTAKKQLNLDSSNELIYSE